MHIYVSPIKGAHKGLVCKANFELSKDQKKNSALWITSKLTDHFKIFHPSLNSGIVNTSTHPINEVKSIYAMFTNDAGRHVNSLQFEKYIENSIYMCKIKMVAWYVYRNKRISKWTFEDKYFCNMVESCYNFGRV